MAGKKPTRKRTSEIIMAILAITIILAMVLSTVRF
jgi:predicted nucleic acid-binding Zn ribbon protein